MVAQAPSWVKEVQHARMVLRLSGCGTPQVIRMWNSSGYQDVELLRMWNSSGDQDVEQLRISGCGTPQAIRICLSHAHLAPATCSCHAIPCYAIPCSASKQASKQARSIAQVEYLYKLYIFYLQVLLRNSIGEQSREQARSIAGKISGVFQYMDYTYTIRYILYLRIFTPYLIQLYLRIFTTYHIRLGDICYTIQRSYLPYAYKKVLLTLCLYKGTTYHIRLGYLLYNAIQWYTIQQIVHHCQVYKQDLQYRRVIITLYRLYTTAKYTTTCASQGA